MARIPFFSRRRRGDDDGGDTVTLDGVVYEVNPDTGFAAGSFADVEALAAAGASRDELVAAALAAPGINQEGAERVADGALHSVGRDDEVQVTVGESELREVSGEEGPEFRRPQSLFTGEGEGGLDEAEKELARRATEGGGFQDAVSVAQDIADEMNLDGGERAALVQAAMDLNREATATGATGAVITEGQAQQVIEARGTPADTTALEASRELQREQQGAKSDAKDAATEALADLLNSTDSVIGPARVDALLSRHGNFSADEKSEIKRDAFTIAHEEAVAAGEDPDIAAARIQGTYVESDLPLWLRQLASDLGVLDPATGDIRDEHLAELTDFYNLVHGENFTTDEVIQAIQPNESGMLVAESALRGTNLLSDIKVHVPGQTDPVPVSEGAVAALSSLGYDTDDIVRLTRTSEMFGNDREGQGAIDERVWALGALARVSGEFTSYTNFIKMQERQAELKEQIEAFETDPPRFTTPAQADLHASRLRKLRAEEQGLARALGIRELKGSGSGVFQLQSALNIGMSRYNDGTLAFIHALDHQLASRLEATGGDPAKMDPADAQQAYDYLVTGFGETHERFGADPLANPTRDVLAQLDSFFNIQNAGRAGGGGGGAATVVRQLDEVAARERIRQMWEAMFLENPQENLVNAFINQLQGQLRAAPPGQEFDVSARINDWLRGTDKFQELFGQKPEGLSEEQFQQQFFAGSADLLGAEAPDIGAIRTGMRTGDFQATLGAIAGSGRAWQNSRFLERWARAAQSVSSLT